MLIEVQRKKARINEKISGECYHHRDAKPAATSVRADDGRGIRLPHRNIPSVSPEGLLRLVKPDIRE